MYILSLLVCKSIIFFNTMPKKLLKKIKTPRHRDTKTPRHRDTKTPRHRDTETSRLVFISVFSWMFIFVDGLFGGWLFRGRLFYGWLFSWIQKKSRFFRDGIFCMIANGQKPKAKSQYLILILRG